jgi:predicted flap endonuclease-1-like 5' DNA nuclease
VYNEINRTLNPSLKNKIKGGVMTPVVGFVLGLLIGWLIEWLIDWFYWRRRFKGLLAASDDCQNRLSAVETELSVSRNIYQPLQDQVSQLELEKAQLEINLAQTQQELETLRAQPTAPSPAWDATRSQPAVDEPVVPDDLQVIKGVGLVISKRLNNNGIFTFEQLASQTPQFLREILGDLVQRLADEESIIEQARQLALQKQNKGTGGP